MEKGMRALTAAEVDQVAGAQDTWVFVGQPFSVPDIPAINNGFYDSVFAGTVGGAMSGLPRGPVGVASGAIAGAVAGGASWAYSVGSSPPTVTYTPVITIQEIPPGGTGGSGGGCYSLR
jgi:hypothetical protein